MSKPGRRVLILSDAFLPMIFGGTEQHYRIVQDALPTDARVVNVQMQFIGQGHQDVHILLESSEWPESPDGEPYPVLTPKLQAIPQGENLMLGAESFATRKVRLCGGPKDGVIFEVSGWLLAIHFTETRGTTLPAVYRPSKKQSSDEMERWDWDGLASMDKIQAEPQPDPIRFREFT